MASTDSQSAHTPLVFEREDVGSFIQDVDEESKDASTATPADSGDTAKSAGHVSASDTNTRPIRKVYRTLSVFNAPTGARAHDAEHVLDVVEPDNGNASSQTSQKASAEVTSAEETLLRTSNFIPFGSFFSGSRKPFKPREEETLSQLSELTTSVDSYFHRPSVEELIETEEVMRYLTEQLFPQSHLRCRSGAQFSNDSASDTTEGLAGRLRGSDPSEPSLKSVDGGGFGAMSMLDARASQQLNQRLRSFYVRHRAYERALKLANVIDAEDDDDNAIDHSDRPMMLFVILTFFAFAAWTPYFVFLETGDRLMFDGTEVSEAVHSAPFSNSLCFALGCTAPMLTDLLAYTPQWFRELKDKKNVETSFAHDMGFMRVCFAVSILIPCIVMLIMASTPDSPLAEFFQANVFWQYSMFGAIGASFFSKFLPLIMTFDGYFPAYVGQLWFFLMSTLFTIGNMVQCAAVFQQDHWWSVVLIAIPFQVSASIFFGGFVLRMAFLIYHGRLRSKIDGNLISPPVMGCICMNVGFSIMLIMDYFVRIRSMSANSRDTTSFMACWHIYVKSVMIILQTILPITIANQNIRRTKGALEKALSLSTTDQQQVPLDVNADPTDDPSLGGNEDYDEEEQEEEEEEEEEGGEEGGEREGGDRERGEAEWKSRDSASFARAGGGQLSSDVEVVSQS